MDALNLARVLLALAPDIFATIERAVPLAQQIIASISHPDEEISQELWDKVHTLIADRRAAWKAEVTKSRKALA